MFISLYLSSDSTCLVKEGRRLARQASKRVPSNNIFPILRNICPCCNVQGAQPLVSWLRMRCLWTVPFCCFSQMAAWATSPIKWSWWEYHWPLHLSPDQLRVSESSLSPLSGVEMTTLSQNCEREHLYYFQGQYLEGMDGKRASSMGVVLGQALEQPEWWQRLCRPWVCQ